MRRGLEVAEFWLEAKKDEAEYALPLMFVLAVPASVGSQDGDARPRKPCSSSGAFQGFSVCVCCSHRFVAEPWACPLTPGVNCSTADGFSLC